MHCFGCFSPAFARRVYVLYYYRTISYAKFDFIG